MIHHVRPLDPEDLRERAEWVRMRRALHGGDDHEADTADVLAGGYGPYGVLVVARKDGGLGGYIEVGERGYAEGCDSRPVAFVESWWVDHDMRRNGAGRALLRAAEEWARARGHREIASDTTIDNELSVTAHRALGFDEVERLVCFHKDLR